ncbi:hypothetical protein Efla_004247 [Eimeria flavescens]
MAVDCEAASSLRRLYPNVFAFAAGDAPQRGGSRAAFEALSFERKTILLPPPYTFSLSRIPASRVSNTYRETYDFTQTPVHVEQGETDVTARAVYREKSRGSSAVFSRVVAVTQPASVLHKEYPLEPHRGGVRHQAAKLNTERSWVRPPAPQPPYRTDEPYEEASDPKKELQARPCSEQEEVEGPLKGAPAIGEPSRRVFMADNAWSPTADESLCCEPPATPRQESWGRLLPACPPSAAPTETTRKGRGSRCVSFVCRAHRGRHVHLLDLVSPRTRGGGRLVHFSSDAAGGDSRREGRDVHKPNCCSAFRMLRRCGLNEAELPAVSELAGQPRMSREPYFDKPVERLSPDVVAATYFPDDKCERGAVETPRGKARRLGLNFKYYNRNYSDPKLLHID